MSSKETYFEERQDGRFAALRRNAKRASALCDTWCGPIKRAKELVTGADPSGESVKQTEFGARPQWRSAARGRNRKEAIA